MAGSEVKHEYHLVNPSPWPLVGSIAATIMMLGAVVWMNSDTGGVLVGGINAEGDGGKWATLKGSWIFMLGFAGVLLTFVGWWRDVIQESLSGENTSTVIRLGLRYGMVLFIASEVMFFVAWFWAFFGAALFPGVCDPIMLADGVTQMTNAEGLPACLGNDGRTHATGGVWPPENVTPLSAWGLPLINTLILLLSGTTVTWAHHAVLHNDQKGLIQGLALTIILGIFFTFLQYLEYEEALKEGFFAFLNGDIYGSAFFMATGFHGFHVIVGTIFLIVCLFRATRGHFTPERHFGFEAAAWYWHFVDVVWLFLFAAVYVFGNQGLLS